VAVSVDWLVGSVVDGGHGTGHGCGKDGSVMGHGVVSDVGVGVEPEISGGSGQDGGQAEEGLHVCD